jgi:hypothetical protein
MEHDNMKQVAMQTKEYTFLEAYAVKYHSCLHQSNRKNYIILQRNMQMITQRLACLVYWFRICLLPIITLEAYSRELKCTKGSSKRKRYSSKNFITVFSVTARIKRIVCKTRLIAFIKNSWMEFPSKFKQ